MEGSTFVIRQARVDDATAMADVHVRSWQETYSELISAEVLNDPECVARRERFWTVALTDERCAKNRVAVAECDRAIVGIAMAGPPRDDDASWALQLHVLYVLAVCHGFGVGVGLLDAVIPSAESVALWVADPNPRAQAFYRKQGFRPDGAVKIVNGIREIRMIRDALPTRQDRSASAAPHVMDSRASMS